MGADSKIEWTDATWNPVTGCSVVSPGCTNCYAMRLAGTRLQHHPSRAGLTRDSKAGPVWTGEVRLNEDWLDQPLRWKRPRLIFVCAHGDLFHESVPDLWLDRVFDVIERAHWHVLQVLTKRSGRMRSYLQRRYSRGSAPGHIWLGVSAEDQARADERIPELLATPAAVRFVSAEPLLGSMDLTRMRGSLGGSCDALAGYIPGSATDHAVRKIDWVICGGESGRDARPMHPAWVRLLRDQCVAAGVPFFFKQWGEWLPADDWYTDHPVSLVLREWNGAAWREVSPSATDYVARIGKKAAGRLLDGRTWDEMPDLRRAA